MKRTNPQKQVYYIKELNQKREKDRVIDEEVDKIKEKINNLQENYQKELYLLLKQMLKLRQRQMKGYGINSLAKEHGLNLTTHQIHYLFGYEHISQYAHKKIDNGEIKLSTALYIIRQDLRFREAQHQDKAIKMYLEGKLKTTEISRLSHEVIFGNVVQNKEIEKANKQLINMSYSLQEYMKTVKSKKKLFTDKKTIKYLMSQCDRLKTELSKISK